MQTNQTARPTHPLVEAVETMLDLEAEHAEDGSRSDDIRRLLELERQARNLAVKLARRPECILPDEIRDAVNYASEHIVGEARRLHEVDPDPRRRAALEELADAFDTAADA